MEIDINGVTYQKIEHQQPTKRPSKSIVMLHAMAMAFGGQGMLGTSKKTQSAPSVNLVAEFRLIQDKKSNLSRSEREYVVREFNKHYKPTV